MDSKNDEMVSLDTAIKYAQVAVFAVRRNQKDTDFIKKEIQVLHDRYGSDGINLFFKGRSKRW